MGIVMVILQTFLTINAFVFCILAILRIGWQVRAYAGNKMRRELMARLPADTVFNVFKWPVTVFVVSLSWIISNFI